MNLFTLADAVLDPVDWALQLAHATGALVALGLGVLPLAAAKGSRLHREAGQLYLVCALLVCLMGGVIALRQTALLLLCFHGFAVYMLLSGWRALYRRGYGSWPDAALLGLLGALALTVAAVAWHTPNPKAALLLMLFAGGSFGMTLHEARLLTRPDTLATGWLNRHVAGMIGSLMVQAVTVAGYFLPAGWLWTLPAALALLAGAATLRRWLRRRRQTVKLDLWLDRSRPTAPEQRAA